MCIWDTWGVFRARNDMCVTTMNHIIGIDTMPKDIQLLNDNSKRMHKYKSEKSRFRWDFHGPRAWVWALMLAVKVTKKWRLMKSKDFGFNIILE